MGDAIEHGEVLGGVAGAFAVKVFAEADVERPVQLIFDTPVLTNGAIRLDAHQTSQRRPFGGLFDQAQIGDHGAAAALAGRERAGCEGQMMCLNEDHHWLPGFSSGEILRHDDAESGLAYVRDFVLQQ
jgi:hypothetical protein